MTFIRLFIIYYSSYFFFFNINLHFFFFFFFFFNDTATTEIYTLSLHDALPISTLQPHPSRGASGSVACRARDRRGHGDRKSTRLNSSHSQISYAVFCLKKKKKKKKKSKYNIKDKLGYT